MRFRLSTKFVFLACTLSFLPIFSVIFWLGHQEKEIIEGAYEQVDSLLEQHLKQVVSDVYLLGETITEQLQERADESLRVVHQLIDSAGGLDLSSDKIFIEGGGENTKEQVQYSYNPILVGDSQSIQSFAAKVKELTQADVIVFQKINNKGDLLRVASTAYSAESSSSVGSLISGESKRVNLIAAHILRGEVYHGVGLEADERFVGIYAPLWDKSGEILGAVFLGFGQDFVEALPRAIAKIQVGSRGYAWMMYEDGINGVQQVVNPGGFGKVISLSKLPTDQEKIIFKTIFDEARSSVAEVVLRKRWNVEGLREELHSGRILYYTYFPDWDWVLGVCAYQDDFISLYRNIKFGIFGFIEKVEVWGGIVFVVMCIVLFLLSRVLFRGSFELERASIFLLKKDIESAISILEKEAFRDPKDEFGRIGFTLLGLIRKIREILNGPKLFLRELQENLTAVLAEFATQKKCINSLDKSISDMSQPLDSFVRESNAMTNLLVETQKILNKASEGSEQIEEHFVGLDENISELNSLNKAINLKGADIERLLKRVDLAVAAISKISDQTSLLALNASVEAEKTGEGGEAFFVIAKEVRKLSEQTFASALIVEDFVKQMKVLMSDRSLEQKSLVSQYSQMQNGLDCIREDVSIVFLRFEDAEKCVKEALNVAREERILSKDLERCVVSLEWTIRDLASVAKGGLERLKRLQNLNADLQKTISVVGDFQFNQKQKKEG